MKKIIVFLYCVCFCLMGVTGAFAANDDKTSKREVLPVWEYLGTETVPSDYNPAGMEVEYSFDKSSVRVGKSVPSYCFWLAKMTKSLNEIEMTYIRMLKDKSKYYEEQRIVYYLDGTIKKAEAVDPGRQRPLAVSSNSVFYDVPEILANKKTLPGNVTMPVFPMNANKLEIKPGRDRYASWLCFLDDQNTGLDAKDNKKLTIVSYAYNPDERVYTRGESYCVRTGPKSYEVTGGVAELYTYEDKLLAEQRTRKAFFISNAEADAIAAYYYMFYKADK